MKGTKTTAPNSESRKQWESIGRAHKEVEAERKAFYARAQWQDRVNKWRTERGEVGEELWARAHGFDESTSDNPLLSGFEEQGAIIQSAMMEEGEDHVEQVLDRIREGFEAEMKSESIKPARQSAILNLDDMYWGLKHSFRSGVLNHRTVGEALSFGAGVMRLAMKEPNGEIAAKLDKLLGMDFSKAAARGMEQVIRKREKKRQDARKSAADAKRKASAIAKMKNLVPKLGQVEASEIVERRINKRHYESNGAIQKVLPVTPGTVRRWYNAKLEEENEARNEAAKRRLGRIPT